MSFMRWQPQELHGELKPEQWANLQADLYVDDPDQVALAADEWTGFMDPVREDLADYPFNGYLSNGIWIEIGRNTDPAGTDIFSVLFFTRGEQAISQLKVGADSLLDHLQMAGVAVRNVKWQQHPHRG